MSNVEDEITQIHGIRKGTDWEVTVRTPEHKVTRNGVSFAAARTFAVHALERLIQSSRGPK